MQPWRVYVPSVIAVIVVIAGLATVTTLLNGTSSRSNVDGVSSSKSSTDGLCNFSPDVMTMANKIQNSPRFIELEGGVNYRFVSAYSNSNGGTALVGGTILSNGVTSWATTIYYPPDWVFWFMPLTAYCTNGGSWESVPYIRATVTLDARGRFDEGSIGLDSGIFLHNGTG